VRILLAQNSLYYPGHGGGDKSNRLLLEALAARGHQCRVVARIAEFGPQHEAAYLETLAARGVTPTSTLGGVVVFARADVEIRVVTNSVLRAAFQSQVDSFDPEVILVSTDDPAQVLLPSALGAPHARVIYLARATLALPFGPDCAFPSDSRTQHLRGCDLVVGVSQYVADYVREYSGIPAVHVPISLMEPGPYPDLGRFENEFVTLVNPCAVKGIAIFLALADAFPQLQFAVVPTWGTTAQDRAALTARPNVHVLAPVDDIDALLAKTRVLLVPSLWAEARSRIVLEAMLRAVPVIAANVGGIPEAKMGVPYLLPVNPIQRYGANVDEQMVPVADVPPQEICPWRDALVRLTSDPVHYWTVSEQSRSAALAYAEELHAGHFEKLLAGGKRAAPAPKPARSLSPEELSPEKRKLLALRLRDKSKPAGWFPGIETPAARRLFYFPHAGAGAHACHGLTLPNWTVTPVRLPGRESRLAEAPFERMAPLIAALTGAIQNHLEAPFAFFGHSMGAIVAFELARELRRRNLPLPRMLIASAARAPQFRRGHVPAPAPSRADFLEELRRLQSVESATLDSPEFLHTLLPALEADSTLYRNYIYSEGAPLDLPIRAYGGVEDPNIRRDHLDGWGEQTTQSFALRLFPGGHFYLSALPSARTSESSSESRLKNSAGDGSDRFPVLLAHSTSFLQALGMDLPG
jgi:surfactin synthase thioesterase subunit/glycosyltransferase involved in cell wall biosynthesis